MPSKRSVRALCAAAAVTLVAMGAARAAEPAKTITGMWLSDPKDYAPEASAREKMELTPAAAAAQAQLRQKTSAVQSTLSDRSRKCLPIGMPGMMTNEFALEFLETPGRVTVLSGKQLPAAQHLSERGGPYDGARAQLERPLHRPLGGQDPGGRHHQLQRPHGRGEPARRAFARPPIWWSATICKALTSWSAR